nr:MAG TPA: hypothetical protein [Caudoviricetes sp.]
MRLNNTVLFCEIALCRICKQHTCTLHIFNIRTRLNYTKSCK